MESHPIEISKTVFYLKRTIEFVEEGNYQEAITIIGQRTQQIGKIIARLDDERRALYTLRDMISGEENAKVP